MASDREAGEEPLDNSQKRLDAKRFRGQFGLRERESMALGYDWIAGVLDSDAVHGTESDSYYEELRGFRRANREECTKVFSTSSKEVGNAKTTRVLDEEVISMPIKGQCMFVLLYIFRQMNW
jgi:hypothetical protein